MHPKGNEEWTERFENESDTGRRQGNKTADQGARNDRFARVRGLQHSQWEGAHHGVEQMFVNIDNIPESHKYGNFWNQFTDLNSTELDEYAYGVLIQIWSLVEDFFKQLLTSLRGELNLLAQKFYIRTCDKKKQFEIKHKMTTEYAVEQMPLRQLVYEIAHDLAEYYSGDEGYSFWTNLHKAVPVSYKSARSFQDVADVTLNAGSSEGLSIFKQRMKQYFATIPEPYLMTLVVNYVRQIFYVAQDTLRRKLEYITIPE